MSFCSIYDISLRHWWYPLRSTDGIINLRLLHGTSQEALFDFDDGGALWLLGLLVTECNFQGKYINAIWESYCCSLSLGFDLELNNFIVCLLTRACQSWFSDWFIVLYKHSWLLQVLENLVKLFGRFQTVPGQVDLFKRSNSITLASQFGPLLFCDIAISFVYWCPSTAVSSTSRCR